MPFLGSLEECATSSRCQWLEQSSVFVGRMGNIAIYLRLPCWRFTRRNLPIHSELVSGVFRVGLQEGFPNVANIYIFFFFFFSEHIIVRTSLPIMSLQIDACPPPLCLLLSSYQTHLGCLSPIFVLGFICFFSLLQFLALLSSLNHCDE